MKKLIVIVSVFSLFIILSCKEETKKLKGNSEFNLSVSVGPMTNCIEIKINESKLLKPQKINYNVQAKLFDPPIRPITCTQAIVQMATEGYRPANAYELNALNESYPLIESIDGCPNWIILALGSTYVADSITVAVALSEGSYGRYMYESQFDNTKGGSCYFLGVKD